MGEIALILRAGREIRPQARHIAEEHAAQRQRADDQPRHGPAHGVLRPESGIQRSQQDQRHRKRDAHVQRRVDAQIHPRERHQQNDGKADPTHPFAPGHDGGRAEGADGVLRMAGWEGIAGGGGAGALYNGEIRVEHPRARDAADDLQKLIADRAEQARHEGVIASALIHAPEQRERQHHKGQLVAEIGDRAEKDVQSGQTNALQQPKKMHSSSS